MIDPYELLVRELGPARVLRDEELDDEDEGARLARIVDRLNEAK